MALDRQEFTAELTRVFAKNGLGKYLSREMSEKFALLTEHMLEENEKFNLTAITDPKKIILNHYADCAALAVRLPKKAKVLDIGCGAGFPSVPVAMLREDVTVLAMDSTEKRITYVKGCADLLGLTNLDAVVSRAEDGAKEPNLRESFDIVTARAVAEMRVLAELALPYVKVGGKLLAMKGKNAAFELADAKKALAILGGKDAAVEDITLTDGSETLTHPLISVTKGTKTPAAYPRAYAQISKKPL